MNEYDMQEQNRRNNDNREEYDRRTRNGMDMRMGTSTLQGHMDIGSIKTSDNERTRMLEDVYLKIDERMCKALNFHEQLADYFCFLGLQGFKRMCEYQYMKECAEKRKIHKRYIDIHHKILPTVGCSGVNIIPKEWERHTTHDIDDSVIPKYTKMALKTYYEWETETKDLYKEFCNKLLQMGEHSDYEFLKEIVLDVEKEIKKIMRLYENLNGTGYDVNAIQSVQDKYHEKYKKKYNDRFTTKNNYRYIPPYAQYGDNEERETRRIGFEY